MTIPYRESLVGTLERSLQRDFNRQDLRLTRKPNKYAGPLKITLGTHDRDAPAEDWAFPVMHVYLTDNQPSGFYFGFAADFSASARDYALQHSSLVVLQDVIGELIPLFRAEWDQEAALDGSSHAQPHWHFVQRPRDIEKMVRDVIQPTRPFDPENDAQMFAGIADCGRFHFAMSSLENMKQSASHKQRFDQQDFRKWFANLTSYIAGQIAYLVEKAPAKAKEFGVD